MLPLPFTVEELPLSSIAPDPRPVRGPAGRDDPEDQRLRASLQQHRVLVPLIVRRARGGSFVIVDGHRRYRAAQALGLTSVRCQVYPRLSAGDVAILRWALHQTHDPWTQAELRALQVKLQRIDVGGAAAGE